jgi:hypothetical protein
MNKPVKIRAVPITEHPGLNGFLSDLKDAIEQQQAVPSPQPVTNLKATPTSGAIVVSFTRSNAANFRLYYGSSPDRTKASIVDLGNNNQWTDNVGQGGIKRFYWAQAITPNALSPSSITGPITATSLALGTNTTVPEQNVVEQSSVLVFDATIHAYRPAIYGQDYVTPGKQG